MPTNPEQSFNETLGKQPIRTREIKRLKIPPILWRVTERSGNADQSNLAVLCVYIIQTIKCDLTAQDSDSDI